jgi:hypothetical protein
VVSMPLFPLLPRVPFHGNVAAVTVRLLLSCIVCMRVIGYVRSALCSRLVLR